jgi:hypothetical protein
MDPYLEDPAIWPDFHATFINYWREALATLLPDHYDVRIGERVSLVQVSPERLKRIGPDVSITRGTAPASKPSTSAGIATLEPVTIPNLLEQENREVFIEIVRRRDRKLVTVLELLSPANKVEPGRGLYLAKRNAVLLQDVHLFELDLLLGGHRLPLEEPLPTGDHYALVSRADRRPNCDVYAWTIEQRLPVLPVPLKAPDPDIVVDLDAVFATTYERGRYGRSLDYEAPPEIPLEGDLRTWIAERAKAKKSL